MRMTTVRDKIETWMNPFVWNKIKFVNGPPASSRLHNLQY